jgi:hypothetical protein
MARGHLTLQKYSTRTPADTKVQHADTSCCDRCAGGVRGMNDAVGGRVQHK